MIKLNNKKVFFLHLYTAQKGNLKINTYLATM